MKKIPLISSLGLLIGAFCTSICFAQDLFNKNEPIEIKQLQAVESGQQIGGYPILSLGNQLKIMRLKTTHSTGQASGLPLGNAYFVDIRDGKFFADIRMQGNLETSSMSDWTDEPCKRDNYLWKRSTGGAFRDINCAYINHITKFYVTPTGDYQQYLVAFRDMGVELPPTIVGVEFTRYSSYGRRLQYRVSINPELFGIERDAEQLWGSNSWYKDFVNRDPKKVKFLASLTKWAEDVQNKMDDAFEKKPDAFSNIQPLTSYFNN